MAFSRILIFVVLSLVGVALLPLLSVNLTPTTHLPELTIQYVWQNASAKTIEHEITSKLESAFSLIEGVENMESTSENERGFINIRFDKYVDFNFARFEVASVIRQIYPQLPPTVAMPTISINTTSEINNRLLTYTLSYSGDNYDTLKEVQNKIKNIVAQIKGVQTVDVYGAPIYEWEISYSAHNLQQMNVSPLQITDAIKNASFKANLGNGIEIIKNRHAIKTSQYPVHLLFSNSTHWNWNILPIAKQDNRIIYLSNIAKVSRKQQKQELIFRTNGLNTINIVITANKDYNSLRVGNEVKKALNTISKTLPNDIVLRQTYDATEYIKTELYKIAWRTLLVLTTLFIFVYIVSRNLRYVFLIIASFFVNISIAFIFYYLLNIQIHLYSLAGITVSFGLIIDNSIVMIDHIKQYKNKEVFLAILAATLTTVGALSVVFFLPKQLQINLIDFLWVILINLSISLLVAFYFIPALQQKISIKNRNTSVSFRRLRTIYQLGIFYSKIIRLSIRFRFLLISLIILVFGFPVFYLPDKTDVPVYNSTLGNDWYIRHIKPYINTYLGGTLRLFLQGTFQPQRQEVMERTKIFVNVEMPYETSMEQTNELMIEVEKMVSQYPQIEQYQTYIPNAQNASIIVYFTKEAELTAFPFFIETKLKEKALFLGGAEWKVYGVGKGFNNSLKERTGQYKMALYGYNFEELTHFATKLRKRLLENPRINHVYFMSRNNWERNPVYEYNVRIDKLKLIKSNLTPADVYFYLSQYQLYNYPMMNVLVNNQYEAVILSATEAKKFDVWNLKNIPIKTNKGMIKLSDIASIHKEATTAEICKQNQQYRLIVEYDFIGTETLGKKYYDSEYEQIKAELPLGYTIEKISYSTENKAQSHHYWLLFLVIVIIYFITAILFESLIMPFAIISMIPISFIGIFITFYLFGINFNHGVFASMILISGITVNAAIYIANNYNNYRKNIEQKSFIYLYIKSFQFKIIPIIHTIISTILGFFPFLIAGKSDVFWFSLALGTMGGLLFSLLGLIIYLPIFLKSNDKN